MLSLETKQTTNKEFEPTAVQEIFLRKVAEKYHYLCLGDTDHYAYPDIKKAAYNDTLRKAFNEAGKKTIFVEDKLDRWNLLMLNAGASTQIEPMDKRQLPDLSNIPTMPLKTLYFMVWLLCNAKKVVDDTLTYEAIRDRNEPSVLVYGSSHFTEKKFSKCLLNFIQASGQSFAVGNMYYDENQRAEAKKNTKNDIREPDFELVMHPDSQSPHGIIINNPELQELYDEAIEEAKTYEKPISPYAGIVGAHTKHTEMPYRRF